MSRGTYAAVEEVLSPNRAMLPRSMR
jgi:hypothetical protein